MQSGTREKERTLFNLSQFIYKLNSLILPTATVKYKQSTLFPSSWFACDITLKTILSYRMVQKLSSKLVHIFSKYWWILFQIYISQSSVATQLRCGGLFYNRIVNLPQNVPVKKVENRSIYLTKVWTKVFGLLFGPPCISDIDHGLGGFPCAWDVP